jgi:hypothetical protein
MNTRYPISETSKFPFWHVAGSGSNPILYLEEPVTLGESSKIALTPVTDNNL